MPDGRARAAARDGTPAPRTLNNLTVTRDDIDGVVRRLAKAPTVKERARTPGLDPRRADIILAGALILEQVVDAIGVDELTFSDYALREGVLLDTWRREHGGSLHHLSDLRRRSVVRLAEQMDEDPDHSAQVARLALELFDATADRHGLGDDSREVLEAAALLANVGLFVSHAGHHKHSYYVIRNSEQLTGFTDREIELIAQVARYHRKSAPRQKHPEFAALGARRPAAGARAGRPAAGGGRASTATTPAASALGACRRRRAGRSSSRSRPPTAGRLARALRGQRRGPACWPRRSARRSRWSRSSTAAVATPA